MPIFALRTGNPPPVRASALSQIQYHTSLVTRYTSQLDAPSGQATVAVGTYCTYDDFSGSNRFRLRKQVPGTV